MFASTRLTLLENCPPKQFYCHFKEEIFVKTDFLGWDPVCFSLDMVWLSRKSKIKSFQEKKFDIFGTLFERILSKLWAIFTKFWSISPKFWLIFTKFWSKFSFEREIDFSDFGTLGENNQWICTRLRDFWGMKKVPLFMARTYLSPVLP